MCLWNTYMVVCGINGSVCQLLYVQYMNSGMRKMNLPVEDLYGRMWYKRVSLSRLGYSEHEYWYQKYALACSINRSVQVAAPLCAISRSVQVPAPLCAINRSVQVPAPLCSINRSVQVPAPLCAINRSVNISKVLCV